MVRSGPNFESGPKQIKPERKRTGTVCQSKNLPELDPGVWNSEILVEYKHPVLGEAWYPTLR